MNELADNLLVKGNILNIFSKLLDDKNSDGSHNVISSDKSCKKYNKKQVKRISKWIKKTFIELNKIGIEVFVKWGDKKFINFQFLMDMINNQYIPNNSKEMAQAIVMKFYIDFLCWKRGGIKPPDKIRNIRKNIFNKAKKHI